MNSDKRTNIISRQKGHGRQRWLVLHTHTHKSYLAGSWVDPGVPGMDHAKEAKLRQTSACKIFMMVELSERKSYSFSKIYFLCASGAGKNEGKIFDTLDTN